MFIGQENKNSSEKEGRNQCWKNKKNISYLCTYAIFSDGDLQGSSNSSSLSSLFSPSTPSSPVTLNDEEVNISGTGKIDGLRLPVEKN